VKSCAGRGLQKTSFPDPGSKIKFNRLERTQPLGFRIYADFESLLPDYDEDNVQQMQRVMKKKPMAPSNATTKLQQHKPCGYSWLVVDFEGKKRYGSHYRIQRADEDPTEQFLKEILDVCDVIQAELDAFQLDADKNMWIDEVELQEATRNERCCFCTGHFNIRTEKIVRHHNHLPDESGLFKFIGLAHDNCNLRARMSRQIPIFMNNFGSYDLHFLMQSLGNLKKDRVIRTAEAIPKSSEKFLSLTVNGNVKFTDSLAFTLSSLEKLVATMKVDGTDKFTLTRQEFQSEADRGADIDLLFQKGAYPYSLMKSVDDFKMDKLPDAKTFFNDLTEDAIKDEVYQHALKVWDSFQIKNMGEWHDLYVRLDTALLADVMENTRRIMMESYGLEIGHYYSIPMVAWDALLKMTDVTLDHITDPTMHCWIESAIRGGFVSVGSARSAKANNPYMGDEYNENLPTSYISYIDANNLYGKSMSYPLPTGEMSFLNDSTTRSIQSDLQGFIRRIPKDGGVGYMMEVDLEIPTEHHDKFNEYPPAPEKRCVKESEMSKSYQIPLMSDLDEGSALYRTPKLVADLNNKTGYVAHYRTLQEYISMGVKVVKVHKILKFAQSAWMKKYIDFNTDLRSKAKTEFEKNFWKLMNNSAFGKTIEQKRNRQNIRIVMSQKSAEEYTRKATVQKIVPINKDTCLFVMKRLSVHLDKPIAVGTSVLEISKAIMYDMHYNCMKTYYGDRATLLYTDTGKSILFSEF
jgi:hypothetical protein